MKVNKTDAKALLHRRGEHGREMRSRGCDASTGWSILSIGSPCSVQIFEQVTLDFSE